MLTGDLDIVLGAQESIPTVLRNNGDGSFAEVASIPGSLSRSRFRLGRYHDGDGDPDAALLRTKGASKIDNKLHVFTNERSGQFKERGLPAKKACLLLERTITVWLTSIKMAH